MNLVFSYLIGIYIDIFRRFRYRKQIRGFIKSFGLSFFWAFFGWFYSGGEKCGFSQFPTFGLQALDKT
jgi:hypothetical protein